MTSDNPHHGSAALLLGGHERGGPPHRFGHPQTVEIKHWLVRQGNPRHERTSRLRGSDTRLRIQAEGTRPRRAAGRRLHGLLRTRRRADLDDARGQDAALARAAMRTACNG